MKSRTAPAISIIAASVLLTAAWAHGTAGIERGSQARADLLERIGPENVTAGILYDLVLPMSGIERFDGGSAAPPVRLQGWKQIYHELYRASIEPPDRPELQTLLKAAREDAASGAVPIGIIDLRYDVLREDGGCEERRAFAASALTGRTYHGAHSRFVAGPEWYFTGGGRGEAFFPRLLEIDFGDGTGPRRMQPGTAVTVSYGTAGEKVCRVRCEDESGEVLEASFVFEVAALAAPAPHDTIHVTATTPYDGRYASGDAYVYLSDLNASLNYPIVVIEGFDIDNTMFWDELYNDLNQESLVETARAEGFDIVVLNFLDSTDYIQCNAFVVAELLAQVQAMIPPSHDIALIGASMGGLCGRYALAWMEHNGLPHGVRTFISFDVPNQGANIPLGVQYWVKFFSEQSEAAGEMLAGLESPSARQMLLYHFTDPPGTTGGSDPLKGVLEDEMAALGGYPSLPRKVAVANGSGHAAGQGFAPGEQIIYYEYTSILVDITGNCWAVGDGANGIIFDGLIDMFWPLPDDAMTVYASGTQPLDNAPGGSRPSMAQMDSTEAPYGDIVALHERHCFIPTVSALDIATGDLFYDISSDPSIMDITPFDTIYYPEVNEGHVFISPECAGWLLAEIKIGVTGDGDLPPAPAAAALSQNWPNPFNPSTTIEYGLARRGRVTLDVYDSAGRFVASLVDEVKDPGWYRAVWNGRSAAGGPVASGVYFCRLRTGPSETTRKMVLLR